MKGGAKIAKQKKKKSNAEGLIRIFKKNLIGKLTEQEKAQFDRARFADEQAKKNSFILGGHINRS